MAWAKPALGAPIYTAPVRGGIVLGVPSTMVGVPTTMVGINTPSTMVGTPTIVVGV